MKGGCPHARRGGVERQANGQNWSGRAAQCTPAAAVGTEALDGKSCMHLGWGGGVWGPSVRPCKRAPPARIAPSRPPRAPPTLVAMGLMPECIVPRSRAWNARLGLTPATLWRGVAAPTRGVPEQNCLGTATPHTQNPGTLCFGAARGPQSQHPSNPPRDSPLVNDC